MRSSFNPVHLKKAKDRLSRYLRAVEAYADTNETYKKEVFRRPTVWEKFRALVKR